MFIINLPGMRQWNNDCRSHDQPIPHGVIGIQRQEPLALCKMRERTTAYRGSGIPTTSKGGKLKRHQRAMQTQALFAMIGEKGMINEA
jgi:hypothetical protein